MKFTETALKGAYQIDIEPVTDNRGFFARTWSEAEAQALGLETAVAECSVSYNAEKGTLRGMHFQKAPNEETKLVRCTQGAIYDVLVDVRPQSPTFKQWVGVELSAENHRMLYVPRGVAHGFITLVADSEVYYQISQPYSPEAAAGVRWDDPAFAIMWPMAPTVLSERDQNYPEFRH